MSLSIISWMINRFIHQIYCPCWSANDAKTRSIFDQPNTMSFLPYPNTHNSTDSLDCWRSAKTTRTSVQGAKSMWHYLSYLAYRRKEAPPDQNVRHCQIHSTSQVPQQRCLSSLSTHIITSIQCLTWCWWPRHVDLTKTCAFDIDR